MNLFYNPCVEQPAGTQASPLPSQPAVVHLPVYSLKNSNTDHHCIKKEEDFLITFLTKGRTFPKFLINLCSSKIIT